MGQSQGMGGPAGARPSPELLARAHPLASGILLWLLVAAWLYSLCSATDNLIRELLLVVLVLIAIPSGALRRLWSEKQIGRIVHLDSGGKERTPRLVRSFAFWLDVILCALAIYALQLAEANGRLFAKPDALVVPAALFADVLIYLFLWILFAYLRHAVDPDKPFETRVEQAESALSRREPLWTVCDCVFWSALVLSAAPYGLPFMALFLFTALHTIDDFLDDAVAAPGQDWRRRWLRLLGWRYGVKGRTWILIVAGWLTSWAHEVFTGGTPTPLGGPLHPLISSIGLYVVLVWRYAEEWGEKQREVTKQMDDFRAFMHNASPLATWVLDAAASDGWTDAATQESAELCLRSSQAVWFAVEHFQCRLSARPVDPSSQPAGGPLLTGDVLRAAFARALRTASIRGDKWKLKEPATAMLGTASLDSICSERCSWLAPSEAYLLDVREGEGDTKIDDTQATAVLLLAIQEMLLNALGAQFNIALADRHLSIEASELPESQQLEIRVLNAVHQGWVASGDGSSGLASLELVKGILGIEVVPPQGTPGTNGVVTALRLPRTQTASLGNALAKETRYAASGD